MAALSYSARGYDSAVCCSKISCDAFLSEALYEANKALVKFAAAPRECACWQDGRQSRRWIANVHRVSEKKHPQLFLNLSPI